MEVEKGGRKKWWVNCNTYCQPSSSQTQPSLQQLFHLLYQWVIPANIIIMIIPHIALLLHSPTSLLQHRHLSPDHIPHKRNCMHTTSIYRVLHNILVHYWHCVLSQLTPFHFHCPIFYFLFKPHCDYTLLCMLSVSNSSMLLLKIKYNYIRMSSRLSIIL